MRFVRSSVVDLAPVVLDIAPGVGLCVRETDEDDLAAAPTVVFLLISAPARANVPVVGFYGRGFTLLGAASSTGAVLLSLCTWTRFA